MKDFKGYVFIFSIHNALALGQDSYYATRSAWQVNAGNRSLIPAYAVGLVAGMSVSSYQIKGWNVAAHAPRLHEFTSVDDGKSMFLTLLNQNWGQITGRAGAFRFGVYLIVEFDGRGHYRYVRGYADQDTSFDWE